MSARATHETEAGRDQRPESVEVWDLLLGGGLCRA